MRAGVCAHSSRSWDRPSSPAGRSESSAADLAGGIGRADPALLLLSRPVSRLRAILLRIAIHGVSPSSSQRARPVVALACKPHQDLGFDVTARETGGANHPARPRPDARRQVLKSVDDAVRRMADQVYGRIPIIVPWSRSRVLLEYAAREATAVAGSISPPSSSHRGRQWSLSSQTSAYEVRMSSVGSRCRSWCFLLAIEVVTGRPVPTVLRLRAASTSRHSRSTMTLGTAFSSTSEPCPRAARSRRGSPRPAACRRARTPRCRRSRCAPAGWSAPAPSPRPRA